MIKFEFLNAVHKIDMRQRSRGEYCTILFIDAQIKNNTKLWRSRGQNVSEGCMCLPMTNAFKVFKNGRIDKSKNTEAVSNSWYKPRSSWTREGKFGKAGKKTVEPLASVLISIWRIWRRGTERRPSQGQLIDSEEVYSSKRKTDPVLKAKLAEMRKRWKRNSRLENHTIHPTTKNYPWLNIDQMNSELFQIRKFTDTREKEQTMAMSFPGPFSHSLIFNTRRLLNRGRVWQRGSIGVQSTYKTEGQRERMATQAQARKRKKRTRRWRERNKRRSNRTRKRERRTQWQREGSLHSASKTRRRAKRREPNRRIPRELRGHTWTEYWVTEGRGDEGRSEWERWLQYLPCVAHWMHRCRMRRYEEKEEEEEHLPMQQLDRQPND